MTVASEVKGRCARGRIAGAIVTTALLVIGCAHPKVTPTLADSHPFSQALSYARQVIEANENSIFGTPSSQIPRPQMAAGDGYHRLNQLVSFCYSNTQKSLGPDALAQGFNRACSQRGGVLDNGFCKTTSDPELVLFMVKLTVPRDRCDRQVSMLVPTVEPHTAAFRQARQHEGFLTRVEQQEKLNRDIANAQVRRALEEASWQRMRVRGMTVCRDEQGVRYVGFVEDFTDERMKVSVTRAQLLNAPGYSPGGFKAETIWTRPEGWLPCER
jgi:hypothetical protein